MINHKYLNIVIMVLIIIGGFGLVLKYAPNNEGISGMVGNAYDSDGDGVPDLYDRYPDDPARSEWSPSHDGDTRRDDDGNIWEYEQYIYGEGEWIMIQTAEQAAAAAAATAAAAEEKRLITAREERLGRRQAAYSLVYSILHPDTAVQEALEDWLDMDFTIPGYKAWLEDIDIEYTGYEMAEKWCEGYKDHEASDYFIRTDPFRYDGIGGLPGQSAIITIQGERLEFTSKANTNCEIKGEDAVLAKPKWFFKLDSNGNTIYNGYVYSVSWYIKHPYTQEELLDNADDIEESDFEPDWINDMPDGLEDDGNITFKIELRPYEDHQNCGQYNMKDTYVISDSGKTDAGSGVAQEFDPSGKMNLVPGDAFSETQVFYFKDKIKEICFVFKDWEYNGDDKVFCNTIKEAELDVDPNHIYFPTLDEEEAEPPGDVTPGTGGGGSGGGTCTSSPC